MFGLKRLFQKTEKSYEGLSIPSYGSDIPVVSEKTALSITAVYAAVDRISSALAAVPFNVYERTESGRRLAREHDQYLLVHTAPNRVLNSFQFRKTMYSHVLLTGNAYVQLVRNSINARPASYELINPGLVQDIKLVDGELFYTIQGRRDPVPGYDIIHITALGQLFEDGDYKGKSPIRLHSETIGAAKLRQTYNASVLQKGGYVSGILKTDKVLTPEQKKALREIWENRHSGVGNAGTTPVLEGGVDYKPVNLSPSDVQLIETMQFSVEDIARIYGLPPHMIGHLARATNNNIEHQGIEYVQSCLLPWAVATEKAFDSRIFATADLRTGRFYTRLEINALMRGDIKTRGEFYQMMLDRGVLSINEVRALEEMNTVEGGDLRLVQANMIPISKIEEQYERDNRSAGD